MKPFTQQKFKLNKINTEVQKNESEVSKLHQITLLSKTAVFFKQKNEIVLSERGLRGPQQSVTFDYTFLNLRDEDLCYFQPNTVLETSEGYTLTDTWTFFSNYWWEQYQNLTILNIRATGYLMVRANGFFSSEIAPIYVTTKIHIHPNRQFDIIIKDNA